MLLFGHKIEAQSSISAAGDPGLSSVFFDRHSFLCHASSIAKNLEIGDDYYT